MNKARQVTRRGFLRKAGGTVLAAGLVPQMVPAVSLGKTDRPAASERIIVGCVGVGPQGTAVMRNFLAQKDAQVVAVSDVKKHVLKAAQERVNKHYNDSGCAVYPDFRDLIGRKDIDVVLVATPDHWHVLVSLAAVQAGKDVYMEKPMGLSLAEDQAMRRAVHRYDRRFQFGTQQRSSRKFRFACELVRNGRIGKLHTINVWSPASKAGGSTIPVAVPEWLDYNMWLGQALYKPYTKDRCSNKLWWFISDYALGFIAGWGVHPLDIALWGGRTEKAGNVEIEGKGTFPAEGVCDTALGWDVKMTFANGLNLNFTDNQIPDQWRNRYKRVSDHGTAFEGTQGWVHVDRSGINAQPESLLETTIGPNDIQLYKSDNHVRNLLDCVKSRNETICPIDVAVKADTLCHISDIAIRLEKKLVWDQRKERFLNSDQANQRLSRPMRSPWLL